MSKKGKDKDDKKAKEKVIVGPAEVAEVSENHKGFYVKQIRDLEQRVAAFQRYCDELDVANAENQIKLDRMLSDQNDVVLFIENKLKSKVLEIKDVTKAYKALQESMVREEEQFTEQLEAIKQEHREMEEALSSENESLRKEIKDLEESEKNRHYLSSEIRQLEMELFNQESEHRDSRYMLDKQYRVEKDKLKTEMLEQVKLVANEYKTMSNSQLSETSKRTIREMVAINDKLLKMSEQTSELVDSNDVLHLKVAEQRTKIKILEESEKKLIRKNVCNHHTLSLLKAKCQTLEPEVMMAVVETKDHIEELLAEKRRLHMELKQYRTQLLEHQEQDRVYVREKLLLKQSVHEKEILRGEMKKLILKSAIAIEHVIKPADTKTCLDVDGSETYLLKREQVLEALLLLLNSAKLVIHPSNIPTNYMDLASSYKAKATPSKISMESDEARSGDENDIVNSIDELTFKGLARHYMQNIPQYKVGYLGLVPKRHSQFFKTFPKPRGVSSYHNTQASSHYKPLGTFNKFAASSFYQPRATTSHYNPQGSINNLDDSDWKKPCSKNSVPVRSAPSKPTTTLPRLPSKVLKFAEELIINPPYKETKLFPEGYVMGRGEDGGGGVVEVAEMSKSAVSDQMWMN